jgi:peptidase E
MAGISAGAICWFEDGLTDSFGRPYRALKNGLGFVPGGAVHITMARRSAGQRYCD